MLPRSRGTAGFKRRLSFLPIAKFLLSAPNCLMRGPNSTMPNLITSLPGPQVKTQAPVVVAINDVGVLSADPTKSSRLSLILREKAS
jgi:hypothetical protein